MGKIAISPSGRGPGLIRSPGYGLLRVRQQVIEKRLLHPAEEMPFERRRANGARSFLIGDQDKGAIGTLLQRHFWNNRNSQTGANHSQMLLNCPLSKITCGIMRARLQISMEVSRKQ